MYDLRGMFIEVCDCEVVCPCWVGGRPDGTGCAGVIAWYVERGEIDGVDVSGLSVASVSHHSGHRDAGGWEVVLYVDHEADRDQRTRLEQVFLGRAGGPLAELGALTGEVKDVRRAPIELVGDGRALTLAVGTSVSAELEPLIGLTRRITTLADSALATVLGTPAELGRAPHYRVDIPEHGFEVDVRDTSANRGRFRYVLGGRA